jgi:amino acid transporter
MLGAAVWLNIIGLNIGKWLQNAGGVGTYVPLMMLIGLGAYLWHARGSMTQFTMRNMMPLWNWDTVNFWPQIAFAFTALELCSTMSEEVREPHKTFPRAILGSGVLIAVAYILGTFALLAILPSSDVDPKSGVFQALTTGSISLGIAFFGIVAAFLVLFGNAGGVGTTVAGVARIPFIVGIDRYMPAAFGKIHSKWKTPWVSILVQAGISCCVLLLAQLRENPNDAYQMLVDAGTILYFIPFLYMYAAAIKLAYRADRSANPNAALVPGGKFGVWLAGILGTVVVAAGIALSLIPPGGAKSPWRFEGKVICGTLIAFSIGIFLFLRGARAKSREAAEQVAGD